MKTFFNSIKIIAIAAVLAVGVSYVSAFTSNGAPSPAGNPTNNVPMPINVGGPSFQTKVGSFTTESFLKAGTNTTPGLPGWIVAANAAGASDNGGITSLWQFFQKEFLPGTKSQMKVGSHIAGRPNSPLPSVDKTKFNPKDTSIPLTIDLIDRGTGNNSDAGTQVMDLLAGDVCNNATTVQTNTAGIQFWSTLNNSNADIIARGIQIGDSSAGAMKVLVATDTAGNAVWGTMRIANGQVVVDYPGSSDVATGQALCSTPPADLCPNINGTQTTVPAGMIIDGSGNCVAAPIDLCTNISGIQTTVPTGYDHLSNNTCKKWWDVTVMPGNPGESCKDWMTRNGINTNPDEFRVVRKASTTVGLSPILDASTEPSVPVYWVQQVYPNECLYEKSSVQWATHGAYQYARDTQRAQAENPSVTMAYINAQNTIVNYQYYLLPRGYRPVATFTQRSAYPSTTNLYDRISNLDRSILRQEGVTNLLSGGGGGVLEQNWKMILQEYR